LDTLSILVISYAYIAGFVFLVGTIFFLARWIFKKKGPTGTYLGYPYLFTYPGQNSRLKALENILGRIFLFTSSSDDPFARYTSLVFHWSLWIVIAAHADIVLYPYFTAAGISESTLEAIGNYIGTTLAILMVGSGLILFGRRALNPYLRKISYLSDYFAILLIVAIGISGILMRFWLPGNFAYSEVSPFFLSLVSFAPISVPSDLIFVTHFTLTMTLLFYFPLSKLMHPFSFFTNPTLYTISHPGDVR
jgi:nitrate reductase gamma subunit